MVTRTGTTPPHAQMLPECIQAFSSVTDRLHEIRDGQRELQRDLVSFREDLPKAIAAALRQHAYDCPALQRVLNRAIRGNGGGGTEDDLSTVDAANGDRRLPRWLLYVLLASIGGGSGLFTLLRELGFL